MNNKSVIFAAFIFSLQTLAILCQTNPPKTKVDDIQPKKIENDPLGMSDEMGLGLTLRPISEMEKKIKDDMDIFHSEMMKQFNSFPNLPLNPFSSFDFDNFGKIPGEPKSPKISLDPKSSVEKGDHYDAMADSVEDPFEILRIINNIEKLRTKTPIEPFLNDEKSSANSPRKPEPIAEITVFTFGDDKNGKPEILPYDGTFEFQTLTDHLPKTDEEVDQSTIRNLMSDFVSKMISFMEFLQKSPEVEDPLTEFTGMPDIRIQDNERVYGIPPSAYIDRSTPGMVNITWSSQLGDSNSLAMRIYKDDSGHVIFQKVQLRLHKDHGIEEYNLDEPVYTKSTGTNGAVINLTGGVKINFPTAQSLNNVITGKKENYSTHWLIFSVALLGLVVAGLIMLLSYIMHTRTQFYAKNIKNDDNITKVPIA